MTQVILVRPGSTDYDRQGRIQGTLDIPLTEQGRQQIARVAEELRDLGLDTIFSSPCRAAMETASLLATALGLRLKVIDKLRNLDHGLWQGMQLEEVRRRQPKVFRHWQEHPEQVCPPNGETLASATERAACAIDKLLKKHKDGVVALVAPEPLASIVRNQLSGGDLGDLWKGHGECGTWESLSAGASVPAAG